MREPSNMTSNANHHNPHLEEVIDCLHNSLYLANPSFLNHEQWVESGQRRVLVEKPDDDNSDIYHGAALQLIGIVVNFFF
jgi:hypothetical protein